MIRRVLVADDDEMIRTVLTTALSERGFEVEVALDGLSALNRLREDDFDLALMDYHMPNLDGLASARVLSELLGDAERPPLIAVTADAEGLRSEMPPGLFAAVLRKPFDVDELIATVDARARGVDAMRLARTSEERWRRLGLEGRPRAIALPVGDRAGERVLSAFFQPVAPGETADVIALVSEAGLADVATARLDSGGFAHPVVDLTGRFANKADAIFSASDEASWHTVARAITSFAARRGRMRHDLALDADLPLRVLAYAQARGGELRPFLDPVRRDCFDYPGFFPAERMGETCEELRRQGWMTRHFADRFHVCGSCRSHRLNVREECLTCRSPDLAVGTLIHHFRCAYQGPAEAFEKDAALVCPKCRQHLRHYGSDYDKPGEILACGHCGAANSEPAIGFLCLDCGAHTDGERAEKRDIHAYRVTPAGIAALETPSGRLRATAQPRLEEPSPPPQQPAGEIVVALPRLPAAEIAPPSVEDAAQSRLYVVRYDDGDGACARPGLGLTRGVVRGRLADMVGEGGRVWPGSGEEFVYLDATGAPALADLTGELERLGAGLTPPLRIAITPAGDLEGCDLP